MEREYAGVPDQEKGPCGHASLLLFRREKVFFFTMINNQT